MFIVGLFGSFSGMVGISTQLVFCCPEDPHALLSCQITSPLHFPLQGLDKVALLHKARSRTCTGMAQGSVRRLAG